MQAAFHKQFGFAGTDKLHSTVAHGEDTTKEPGPLKSVDGFPLRDGQSQRSEILVKIAAIGSGDGTGGGQRGRQRPAISRRVVDHTKNTFGRRKRDAGKPNGAAIRPALSLPGNNPAL